MIKNTIRNKLTRIATPRIRLDLHEVATGAIVYAQATWQTYTPAGGRIAFTFPVETYETFAAARKAAMVWLLVLLKATQKLPEGEGYPGDCLDFDMETASFKPVYYYEDDYRHGLDYRISMYKDASTLASEHLDNLLEMAQTINGFKVSYELNNRVGVVNVAAPWEAVDMRNRYLATFPLRAYNGDLEAMSLAVMAKFILLLSAAAKFNVGYARPNAQLEYHRDKNFFKANATTYRYMQTMETCRDSFDDLVQSIGGTSAL